MKAELHNTKTGDDNMKCKFKAIAASTLFLLLVFAGAAAQTPAGTRHPAKTAKTKTYRFNTLDYPGASFSYVSDINTVDKTTVGIFQNESSPSYGTGFVFKGTKYTMLQVQGAIGSALLGINRSDQMVGYYFDSAGLAHGLLDSGGKITVLNYPGSDETLASAINDSGLIVGWRSGVHGFLYDHGNYSSIDYPGAVDTFAYGINSTGDIVGGWFDPSSLHGFLLHAGTFTSLDYPQARTTQALGINDEGEIAGAYTDAYGGQHGFIYSNGVWKTVDVPGVSTFLHQIKNNGQVMGYYYDALNETHGFLGR
jgi:probable HAF family extracellular repeat protein